MRIALVMPAPTKGWGGVQRFASSLHLALREIADVEQVWFHPPVDVPRTPRAWLESGARGVASLLLAHRKAALDGVVSTFHGPPKLVPNVKTMGFVHDLRQWNLQHPCTERPRRATRMVLRAMFSTWDAALVPSPHVASDVSRLVPGLRVENVGEGLDHLDALSTGEPAERSSILAIGGRAPHKRAELALDVLERAVEQLSCPGVFVGQLPRAPRSGRIAVHEGPSDETMVRLYREAKVALVPTQYEGFGLAVGESMRFGTPVVFASDCPLEHLVGAGGTSAPPEPQALTEAVKRVFAGCEVFGAAAREAAAPYTWSQTATRILAAFD